MHAHPDLMQALLQARARELESVSRRLALRALDAPQTTWIQAPRTRPFRKEATCPFAQPA